MAENKTKPTGASVAAFLAKVTDDERRKDCKTLVKMMKSITGSPAHMWGPSIVGFGSYHYKYASGREGDSCLSAFSPRKGDLTIYVVAGFGRFQPLMKKLGKHKTGNVCLYVRRLADIDLVVLEELIGKSVAEMKRLSQRAD